MIRVLEEKDDAAGDFHRRLDTASNQTRRLGKLVSQLLDVSRISSGRLEMHVEEVDLVGLVAETVDRHKHLADGAGSVVTMLADGEVVGRWDRLRLEQLFTNLLNNAIKYAPGKPIEVAVERKGGEAHLRVTDHGMGIEPEHVERIFGRFERAVSSRNYGGLGLGLYISQQIAQAHGGRIEVASEAGKGSTFTVKLPLQTDTGTQPDRARDHDRRRGPQL
jgi:signal transduction histidine kinase